MKKIIDNMLHGKKIRRAVILLFWTALWGILAAAVDNPILLASPAETVRALFRLLEEPVFLRIVGTSLLRIGGGFLLGSGLALLLAALAFRYSFAEELLAPVITLMKTVPVASFVVLLLIWWGAACLSVAVCFLMTFPQIYQSTLQGLKNTDRRLLEMARVFGLPAWNRLCYLYRPALRPFLFSGLKLALGMCWKAGVAAEIIGIPRYSIGGQLYFAKIYLDISGVFAWTVVVLVLSTLFERLMLWLAGRLFAWEPECIPCKKRNVGEGGEKLVLKQLGKGFGGQKVVDNYSAVYEPGKTYVLDSPSGSGKTTLLRLLCGLEQPDEGEVVCEKPDGPVCSMVFQEDRLCEEYSAVRNVEMVLGDRRIARKSLEKLLAPEALDKPCSQLSGGMKRRVALVRAMEADSHIVLLDEPYTGMDEETRCRAQEYVEERRRGRAVILATHI